MDIKPIETVYNGYRFRSRLEARWAVFFDTAGIAYEYEKEGFVLSDGTKYLPDFWLPQFECFFEVKGEYPTSNEKEKARLLSLATKRNTYIAYGEIPYFKDAYVFDEEYDLKKANILDMTDDEVGFECSCGGYENLLLTDDDNPGQSMFFGDPVYVGGKYNSDSARTIIFIEPYKAARQARFEFGENGSNNVLQPTQEGAEQNCTE